MMFTMFQDFHHSSDSVIVQKNDFLNKHLHTKVIETISAMSNHLLSTLGKSLEATCSPLLSSTSFIWVGPTYLIWDFWGFKKVFKKNLMKAFF